MKPVRIEPSVGRVLWYIPAQGDTLNKHRDGQALAAMVAHVNADGTINIGGLNVEGQPFSRLRVPLVQEGDFVDPTKHYCEWMPYQLGQAAKTEQVERLAGMNAPQGSAGVGRATYPPLGGNGAQDGAGSAAPGASEAPGT